MILDVHLSGMSGIELFENHATARRHAAGSSSSATRSPRRPGTEFALWEHSRSSRSHIRSRRFSTSYASMDQR